MTSHQQMPDWVREGMSFRYDFGPGNHNTGRKFHVRAIVDGRAVIREWSRGRQGWIYSVEGWPYFHSFREHIVPVGRRNSTGKVGS